MLWRVEIRDRAGVRDVLGEGVAKGIADLGIPGVTKVTTVQVFNIEGEISEPQIQTICSRLLTDPITQESSYYPAADYQPPISSSGLHVVEIAHNAGVMDPVEESTIKAIRDLGIEGAEGVRTARQYRLYGKVSSPQLNVIVDKVLANKLIQHVVRFDAPEHAALHTSQAVFKVQVVELLDATDIGLTELSKTGQLFLNLNEMKAIRRHFSTLGRNPTDCEMETVAQTWSEHCHHKTFRGDIRCDFQEGRARKKFLIHNLLKSTIVKATQTLARPWCVSVFHDNAGVIAFDDKDNVCFKVETHNHPSALEPFGGANTGVGGVIRDILGTGLGAKPIANTDVFCFASPDHDVKKLPAGTLHPKRIMKGVVSGVRDYGNKMGIPTVNGAICFDEGFLGNPLVYCGTVGIIPRGKELKGALSGDLVVVAGGRTGRDGIHGATFSSGELTSESEVVSSGAVQIGDPIQEKKVADVMLRARDLGLYTAVTDCGAGGLSSAVGEMGQILGARVELERVPLKYQGLSYMEIWISESQERMVFAVPPENLARFLDVFGAENVEATVIGEFTGTGRLELFYQGHQVCDLDMKFLHDGVPKLAKEAVWRAPRRTVQKNSCPKDLSEALHRVLSDYNICSKEWVIRQYDHEVKGGTVIKPLSGRDCDGPSDAAVIVPKLDSRRGLAIANGINSRYGAIDPYWMAASCIDEAIRQVVAVGGDPARIALLDNFCWGNPDKPDRLGGLVRAALGCHDFSVGYGAPFISGKDSLYNEYAVGKKSIAIPGTILISAIGIVGDVGKCVTMDFKQAGNLIYVIGETGDELGGSAYGAVYGRRYAEVPRVDIKRGLKIFSAVHAAIQQGAVRSLHDCSEGGLGVALAEMAFSGGFGVTARLDLVPVSGKVVRNDQVLFSESNSRFLAEVNPQQREKFEQIFKGCPLFCVGRVEATPEFIIYGRDKKPCVQALISELKESWQKPLRW